MDELFLRNGSTIRFTWNVTKDESFQENSLASYPELEVGMKTYTGSWDVKPPVKEKPMKPIQCPMCGKEMEWSGTNCDNELIFSCNATECVLLQIHFLPEETERDVRRAWNKSLIGRLRKEYRKYIKDNLFWSRDFTAIMGEMFGGKDG